MFIDLYELSYRNYKTNNAAKPEKINNIPNDNICRKTTRSILHILGSINKAPSAATAAMEEINFSDIICNLKPVLDEQTQSISYRYEFIFHNVIGDKNPIEYIERFKKFNVNTLPLIDVAKQLNITVEKSNFLNKAYGRFIPNENKIILYSDYIPTFIHELVHAIDNNLGNNFENYHLDDIKNFNELVAEAATFVICKTYNIPINEFYTLKYLDYYYRKNTNMDVFLKRVSLIYEFVKNCTMNNIYPPLLH